MPINGLNKITDRILAEANDEANRILAEAQAECDRIAAESAERAEKLRERLTAQADKDATGMVTRSKSAAVMKKRNILLQTQSELIDQVFAGAMAGMQALADAPYTSLLVGLLSAALAEQLEAEVTSRALYGEEDALLPDAYEIILNPRDRERCGNAVVEGIRKNLTGKVPADKLEKLVLSARTAPIDGGGILRCGSIESNCSFGLLFAQLRGDLESEVGHALFDARTTV